MTWCPGLSRVTRLFVTCNVCHVCRYSTSQGYYQQAAHTLAQADQTRLMAQRLGAAFTWGRAIYEGCLIGQDIKTFQAHTGSEIISLLCQVFSCRLSFSLSSSPSSFTPMQSTSMREQFLLKRHRHDYICRHIENFRRRDSCCVGYHFHVMYRVPLFDR